MIDQRVAKPKPKDRIILELKRAIIALEERVKQLELVLAEVLPKPQIPLEHGTDAPPATLQIPQAPAVAHDEPKSLHPLLTPGTEGVYEDFWTDLEAVLRFVEQAAGGVLRLRFFVPLKGGEQNKKLTMVPNFADPVEVDLVRGEPSPTIDLTVPGELATPPEIRILIDQPEPVSAHDVRRLGVKIIDISIEENGTAPTASGTSMNDVG